MPAHIALQQPGRACRLVCPDCGLDQPYERTRPAQLAAGEHNRDQHAYPEQPLDLDLDTEQEPA